jgi:hypothetical protein
MIVPMKTIGTLLLSVALILGLAFTFSGCSSAPATKTVDDTIYFKGGSCKAKTCSLKRDINDNVMVTNEKGETGYGYIKGNIIRIPAWNSLEGTLSFFDGKVAGIYWYSGIKWLQE